MKKRLASVIAAAVAATPAFAAITTIEFKRDTGETQIVTLDGEGTATNAEGASFPYTYDEATLTLCFELPESKPCATFAEANDDPQVGDSVRYTAADGAEGTATITAIEE